MPKLSKEENLNRVNAADAMLAEIGALDRIKNSSFRDSFESATQYFNFAFRFYWKHVQREAKRKRNSERYKAMHQEYLKTEQWKARRDERLNIDSHKCVDCGAPAQCVHHLHYQTWRREDVVADLVSLCNDCHYARHFGIAADLT